MSRASDYANEVYEEFESATRAYKDVDYVEALEELICMLKSSLTAKQEEMREDEEGN